MRNSEYSHATLKKNESNSILVKLGNNFTCIRLNSFKFKSVMRILTKRAKLFPNLTRQETNVSPTKQSKRPRAKFHQSFADGAN